VEEASDGGGWRAKEKQGRDMANEMCSGEVRGTLGVSAGEANMCSRCRDDGDTAGDVDMDIWTGFWWLFCCNDGQRAWGTSKKLIDLRAQPATQRVEHESNKRRVAGSL